MRLLCPQQLALTSPASDSRSVGIARLRTKATELSVYSALVIVRHPTSRNAAATTTCRSSPHAQPNHGNIMGTAPYFPSIDYHMQKVHEFTLMCIVIIKLCCRIDYHVKEPKFLTADVGGLLV
jgi:hypothetical protein